MGSLSAQGVTKQFGTQIVLEGVGLDVHTGETVGVVGPNGAGKTTLFKIVAGMIPADLGTVTASKGLQIGYLAQDPDLDSTKTLHDEVASAFDHIFALEQRLHDLSDRMAEGHEGSELDTLMADYDRTNAQFITAGGYAFEQRLNEILGGLGFSESDRSLPVSALSGGQRCRAALAKLLLADRQLLLLDEPTNHLDIDAVRWLEKFLAGHHGGSLIVSHDRYLLDRLADRIVEVDRKKVQSYAGNYTTYVKTKELRRLTDDRQYEKDAAFLEKERAFIAKHMAGQRTAEAKGRRTRLERRLADGEFVLEKSTSARAIAFDFAEVTTLSGPALRIEDLSKRYDDKQLFKQLDLQVDAGRRLGITGPNGTGKTTLLRILREEVAADSGTFAFHHKAKIGYYAQHAERMRGSRTVLEDMCATHMGMSEQRARDLLAQFLFTGNNVFKPVERLSGGEQSRIRLLNLLLTAPNVLVLDEPTNHLDVASRGALEDALASFPGAIVAVSHDRYFLDRIVDDLLVIRPEGHRLFAGNYSDYVASIEQQRLQEEKRDRPKRVQEGKKPAETPAPRATARFDHLDIEAIEARIAEREESIAAINARFSDAEVYKDPEAVAALQRELETEHAEMQLLEQAWEERVEQP